MHFVVDKIYGTFKLSVPEPEPLGPVLFLLAYFEVLNLFSYLTVYVVRAFNQSFGTDVLLKKELVVICLHHGPDLVVLAVVEDGVLTK
jgi:hypothetical protein